MKPKNNFDPIKKKLKRYFNYIIELKSQDLNYLKILRSLLPYKIVDFSIIL